jgi:hypothetical protein
VFQRLMGFKKELPIETVEKTKVMSVQLLSLEGFHNCGDAHAFMTHQRRIYNLAAK